jgi:type II secretory pathway pseudopilin PulG
VEIMVVVAIIGLLAAIAVPNFMKHRTTSRAKICMNNIRQIQGAKDQWAIDNGKNETDTPNATDLDTYLKGGTVLVVCPLDDQKTFATSYTVNDVSTMPVCQKDATNHKVPF